MRQFNIMSELKSPQQNLSRSFSNRDINYDEETKNKDIDVLNKNKRTGENWNKYNINTLKTWMCTALHKIEVLDNAIKRYKAYIKFNVIWALILSTASGTISASTISLTGREGFILNIIFTIMSFFIAIVSGIIKIWQIQENIELYIKLKQEWALFSIKIISELNKELILRRDATSLIEYYNNKYLELTKTEIDISKSIIINSERKINNDLNILLNERNKNIPDFDSNLLSGKDLA